MKNFGFLLTVLSVISLSLSSFIWGGYAIYEVVKTDLSFWSIAGWNLFYFSVQSILSLLLYGVGVALTKK